MMLLTRKILLTILALMYEYSELGLSYVSDTRWVHNRIHFWILLQSLHRSEAERLVLTAILRRMELWSLQITIQRFMRPLFRQALRVLVSVNCMSIP